MKQEELLLSNLTAALLAGTTLADVRRIRDQHGPRYYAGRDVDSIHAPNALRWCINAAMIRAVAVAAACLLLAPASVRVQTRDPIIDVHLHASAADSQGPPPVGICTPIDPMPVWTQQTPYPQEFLAMLKKPPCADPVWSPITDDELMQQTIAAVRRLNVFGLLSGRGARLDAWVAAEPERFMPAAALSVADQNGPTVASLRELHALGKLRAIGEVRRSPATTGSSAQSRLQWFSLRPTTRTLRRRVESGRGSAW